TERMFYDKPVTTREAAYVRGHFAAPGCWTGWGKTRILWIRVGKSGDKWYPVGSPASVFPISTASRVRPGMREPHVSRSVQPHARRQRPAGDSGPVSRCRG